jgi:hypothetical protein
MNNYCEIKKNNINIDTNNKYLLSTSFFYLEKCYKSSQRYINGILKILEFIEKNKFYVLRIYYDESIFKNNKYKELFYKIKKNKSVELYEYSCSQFILSKPFHIGTFGTLLRFLPLFEESDYKVIYVLDIDDASYGYINLYMDSLVNSDKKFYFNHIENYGIKYNRQFDNKFGDTVIANIFVKNYRFDIKIFTNFLDYITKSNKLFKQIENLNKNSHILKKSSINIQCTYGLDEYFLNINLINTLDNKDIGWIKENLYFNYFIDKLMYPIDNNLSEIICKEYYLELISLLDDNINKYTKYTSSELKKIFNDVIKIDLRNYKELRKNFLSNYFKFCIQYKKITLEYYDKFYFVFDEIYIDDLIINNFNGISWYLKKNWDLFPKSITSTIKLVIIDKLITNNPCC